MTATALLAGTSTAWADPDYFEGNAHCDAFGCEADAESGQEAPGAAPQAGEESGGGSASGGAGGGSTAPVEAEPNCEEVALGQQECETTLTEADLGDEAVVAEAPIDVADDARDALELPQPGIAASPALGQPVLVQVPVWLWIDEETWSPESAQAEVPGGSVSVTATPTSARWSMGDGTTVTCEGPGVPYVAGRHDPAAASPECGHTYTRASMGEPDGTYDLGVEVTWEVTWESTDGGGELDPLVTSAAAEVDVVESHGLVEPTG
ncbi:hypothetical protein [Streptomonospora arabica]|uniref:ATP/GTP-binding protein n=1 Tax=Streptomonospora arabica TaxID=412417 RepID=A0ABV9SGB3_9ACTN